MIPIVPLIVPVGVSGYRLAMGLGSPCVTHSEADARLSNDASNKIIVDLIILGLCRGTVVVDQRFNVCRMERSSQPVFYSVEVPGC